ncbi:MAG: Fe-S cluster assembly protein HesB [Ignavibacteriales bacterium]|nr:Fe-S cluster assembly protein HesB [Ignavibacteriales bacterium]
MPALNLTKPPAFHFWRTVYSHGWCTLLPFRVDRERETLSCIVRVSDGKLVECTLSDSPRAIRITVAPAEPLSPSQRTDIRRQFAACLRLEEDFSEFYSLARRLNGFRWIPRSGAGRLMRAPTVFEDIVKMLCTTNCSWSLTENMVTNLTNELGSRFSNTLSAFPTPRQMANVSERFYRKTIRAGYRSPYLLELAERVASGSLNVEEWRHSRRTAEDLFKQVRGIKGMGNYAAGSLMRLLGRYDYLALDSWVRSKYAELHHKGRPVGDRTIERAYRGYGSWRGLFFWLDMTREWLTEKFPF